MGLFDDLIPASGGSSLDPTHRDLAIRTVYGEAANEPDHGQAAVAAVIKNRMTAGRYGGDTIPGVVLAKNQFEPWGNSDARARMTSLKQDDPRYQKIAGIVDQVFSGQMEDPTNGATHFVAPAAQAALGRAMPSWAQGEGLPIGRHTFFAPEGRVQTAAAQPPATASGGMFDDLIPQTSGGRFADTAGENFRTAREGASPPAPSGISDYLPRAVSDVPKEAMSATGDALGAVNTYLNPFSEAYQKGAAAEKDQWVGTGPGSIIGTGKGLASALSAPMAPVSGALRSLIGHPYSDVTGMPYDQAKEAVDTAMMGLGARGGPAVVPRPAPAMPPALQANTAAQNIGVELPKAIGTDSQFQRFMGQVANKMPGGGPMQEGVASALRQTGEAVGEAATKAGGVADPMSAGQGFQQGIEGYFKPTTKARVSAAYDAVDNHVSPTFTRPLSETQGAIADIVARRQASGEADPGKAINTVLGGATRPGGLTYAGVKDLRTRVGEMLDTGIFPEGMSQGELRRVYGSLSDDLKATVQAAGGKPAMDAFNRANAMNKFVEEWKDNLGKVLGSDRSGEAITASIQRMASSGSAGDLKALTMARAAVPKNVWQDVATTTVSRLGLDKKGEFSPAIFLNDFTKLSDKGKQLLFGSVGSADVLPHLNDIATVSKKFVEAGKLANTSGTAGHNAAYTMLGGAAAGLMHGSLIEPISAVSAVVGNNLMARALSRPASAASIARWTRAYQALVAGPTPPSAASFKIASGNLANTINGTLGGKFQAADFMKAIQAPATARTDENQ